MHDKKINNHFYDLGVPEDGVECNCMIMISTDFLIIYKKEHYMQVYLDEQVHKIVKKKMTRYLVYDFTEFESNTYTYK